MNRPNPAPLNRAAPALLAAVAVFAALVAACGPEPAPRPNVLLIVVDTLRADRLAPGMMPELGRFAETAVRFTDAQAPRAKTTPAVATLLTGLYPHDHGVRDLASRLRAGVPALAEAFGAAGYTTSAIVGNFVLSGEIGGLGRGFGTWIDDLPDRDGVPPDGVPQRRAASLTDGALTALGLAPPPVPRAGAGGAAPAGPLVEPVGPLVEKDRPWFLYLHYMDPHGAYDPPAEHRRAPGAPDPVPLPGELPPHPLHQRRVGEYNVPDACRGPDGRADAECVRALYDGEVRFADAEIGRLLRAADAAGLLQDTIVVVTADHGESLGEHRYWFEHGRYAYQATCHVPLLLRAPGLPAGENRSVVSLADIAPTLLDLAGLPPLRAFGEGPRGRSLVPWLAPGAPPARDRAVFSEKLEGAQVPGAVQIKAVRLGDWKLIRRYALRGLTREPTAGAGAGAGAGAESDAALEPQLIDEQLYDLAADPGETVNLADAPPPQAPLARLRAELLRFTAADAPFAELARQLDEEAERLGRDDPEAARILREMGYLR